MTRALAIELAREKITVNAIMPGPFATEMNLPLTEDPEKYAAFIAKIPMGRWGELHEIGGLALYLASPASSYVTGAGFRSTAAGPHSNQDLRTSDLMTT